MSADILLIKSELDASGQSHLYKYWEGLSLEEKEHYFRELLALNLDRITSAYMVIFQLER